MSDVENTTEFKHDTDFSWNDISSEQFRVYEFAEKQVRIDNPLQLNVSRSGGHRVFDASGVSHYIPGGWIHLFWKAKQGQPNFVK